MRQTNIVWVAMVLGYTIMDKLISQTLPFIKGTEKRLNSAYKFQVIKRKYSILIYDIHVMTLFIQYTYRIFNCRIFFRCLDFISNVLT